MCRLALEKQGLCVSWAAQLLRLSKGPGTTHPVWFCVGGWVEERHKEFLGWDEMKWVFYAPGGWFPLWDFPPCVLCLSEVCLYTIAKYRLGLFQSLFRLRPHISSPCRRVRTTGKSTRSPEGWILSPNHTHKTSLAGKVRLVGTRLMPVFIHQGEVGCGSLALFGMRVVWLRAF